MSDRTISLTVSPDTATGILRPFDGNVPYASTRTGNRLQWAIRETGGALVWVSAPGWKTIDAYAVLPEGSNELRWSLVQGQEVAQPMDLEPDAPAIQPLHVDGRQLVQADGTQYRYRGATHFLHFQRYLEWKRGNGGEPCDYAGAVDYRVTALMTYIPGTVGLPVLRPENYANYWTEAPGYVQYLAAKGRRLHLCVCCDIQMSGQSVSQLRSIIGQWGEIVGNRALLSNGNEAFKNGWNPRDFSKPTGTIWSSGTNEADGPPDYAAEDDFIEWEGRRDWPKVTSSSEDQWYVSRDSGKPILHSETMGFAEYNQPGKRSNDPQLARQIGASCAALNGDDRSRGGYVNGGAVHLQEAITSVPLGPIQDACRAAFFEGLQ